MWWSFYEIGATMAAFVRHALAYVTGQDPDSFSKETSHYQRCQELLTVLRARPFLLVLDGFERVLTAYQSWDKAQQRDETIDADLRKCAEPRDGELLQQLLHGGPSKVILSTRLFPHALGDRASRRPIPGVAHHKLGGLSRPDALAFVRHAGIQGNEQAMLDFAMEFGYHSLLLKVVCGEIANYQRKPFDFDIWRADPIYGGKLKLSTLDLKQRKHHILRFALDGLDEQKRKLLCRIAVLSETVTYETLAVLNPFLPPRPDHAPAPARGADRQAVRDFDTALKELQDRGLLQWDRDSGAYDMHPVVRGHAAEVLDDADRKQTFLILCDHFAGLPPDDFGTATDLSHVAHSLRVYRCLIGADRVEGAVGFLAKDLILTLYHHIGAYSVIPELAASLFPNRDFDATPLVAFSHNLCRILDCLGNSLAAVGRKEEAISVYTRLLGYDLQCGSHKDVTMDLRNLWELFVELGRFAEGYAILNAARDIGELAGGRDGLTKTIFKQMCQAIVQGEFGEYERFQTEFLARPRPPQIYYQVGDLEYWCCVSHFYQGRLSLTELQAGYELSVRERNVRGQHRFLSLRAEVELRAARPAAALDAIDEAIKVVNRLGSPSLGYHDLRAWALAELGRAADARANSRAANTAGTPRRRGERSATAHRSGPAP